MSEASIQRAVFARLTTFSALTSLLADGADSVYDHVPQSAKGEDNDPYPFVTIGDDTHSVWDTDDTDGLESSLTVHVWSRHRGRIEVKDIQAKVKAALHHHPLPVDGVPVVLLHFVDSSADRDPDGLTQHGVQGFRMLSEEVA